MLISCCFEQVTLHTGYR